MGAEILNVIFKLGGRNRRDLPAYRNKNLKKDKKHIISVQHRLHLTKMLQKEERKWKP